MHDSWYDQNLRGGHEGRLEDLALFADLGIRKLRYPALWERMAPTSPERTDFAWTDQRLDEIRRLGMEPIVTLCHHGSGPRYTSLLEGGFAQGLARHAAAVARRYPWVGDYTPVNEPLTTARFSALYGFWYPHERNEGAFWTALLNEIDATRLAMRAIRLINPAARLIQTDDLGFCHATAPLQAEATFQNERRWMGWDLLCGMVEPGHPLWDRLARYGLEDRLRLIADDPCPPDVIGINHYLSSERLLDHRIERHADRSIADRDLGEYDGVRHVDVDAIRSVPDRVIGPARLVEQAWERYHRPVAITECHHGSTREEQARWFIEIWRVAETLRAKGIDIEAVTAWSLLGSYDWNRMVTTTAGHYEPGVFDVRGGTPLPTLMTSVLRSLAKGEQPSGPGLDVPGWWNAERMAQRTSGTSAFAVAHGPRPVTSPRPLVIVGDDTALSELAAETCEHRGLHHVLLRDAGEAARVAFPWAVLDARIAPPPRSRDMLAGLCRQRGISGAVLHRHGNSAVAKNSRLLTVNTGPVFTAADDTVLGLLLDRLDDGDSVSVDASANWEGVYAPTMLDGVLDMLLDGARGQVHFVAEQDWSLAEVARALAGVAGHPPCRVLARGAPAPRCAPDREMVSYLPPLDSVLERFVADRRRHRANLEAPAGGFEQAAE